VVSESDIDHLVDVAIEGIAHAIKP
jgi:hypothetical protein